jgi:hypothetical protein
MDRLFSYASSYELQNPDPDRKFGIRIRIRPDLYPDLDQQH